MRIVQKGRIHRCTASTAGIMDKYCDAATPTRRREFFFPAGCYIPSYRLRAALVMLSLAGTVHVFAAGGTVQQHGGTALPARTLMSAPFLRLRGAGDEDINLVDPSNLWDRSREADEVEVKSLLKEGADPNARGKYGDTPLRVAVKSGNARIVKILMDAGATIAAAEDSDCGPGMKQPLLFQAARWGHADVVRELCTGGANANRCDYENKTALHIAAQFMHEPTVRALLEGGADPNWRNWHGQTPLQRASERGGAAACRTLLQFGADPSIVDRGFWREPLHYARNAETVAALLEGGANHTAVDKDGKTPLHEAALRGDPATIEALVNGGARSLNWQTPPERTSPDYERYGDTPLHIAVRNGRVAAAKALLDRGADTELRNEGGATALFLAAKYGHDEMVCALLRQGAALNTPNEEGLTPLRIARDWRRTAVAELLDEAGASVEADPVPPPAVPDARVEWQPGRRPVIKLTPKAGMDPAEVAALEQHESLQVPWGAELKGEWDPNVPIRKVGPPSFQGPTILRHPRRFGFDK